MILFCSAIAEEQAQLRTPNSIVTGIGNLESALQLESFLQNHRSISGVVFLGSCGEYSKRSNGEMPNIDCLVTCSVFFQRELTEERLESKRVSDTKIFEFSPVLDWELPSVICNSPSVLSLVSWKPSTPVSDITMVENLECYGLAKVCEKKEIPFQALFAITNEVGPEGSNQWKSNYRHLAIMLVNYCNDRLSA